MRTLRNIRLLFGKVRAGLRGSHTYSRCWAISKLTRSAQKLPCSAVQVINQRAYSNISRSGLGVKRTFSAARATVQAV